ncbi:hypothetical protein N9903_00425 [bacterium]|nr:hypothetical protein [bacterium]
MSDTLRDTAVLLDAMEIEIRRGRFRSEKQPRRIVAWNRHGIAFVTRMRPSSASLPGFSRGPITVVTPHAHTAGWLLTRIDEAFAPLLGRQYSWDFFERIAEAVTEHLAFIPPGEDTAVNLLKVILREARDICSEMAEGDFPCLYLEEGDLR